MEQAQRFVTPFAPPAHWSSALERQRRGDTAGAVLAYQRHLDDAPQDVAGWMALAVAQRRIGQPDAALLSLQRALRLAPRDAGVWSNLGTVWMELGQLEQALRAHRRAVDLDGSRIDLALHCAVALREAQHFAEAERLVDECLAREPGRADLRHERALLCLYTGRWRAAWPDYEARLELARAPGPPLASPRWAGERIGAKRLLLVAEADAGETLWAARYIALLARRGAALSLVIDAALHPLLEPLPVRLLRPDDVRITREPFDFHCPLAVLPWLVDPRGATIPEPTVLGAAGEMACEPIDFEPADGAGQLLRIGYATGAAGRPCGLHRAPEAERFHRLAAVAGVRLVELAPRRAADASPPAGIRTGARPGGVYDLVCLASTIGSLDLVITTDNPVAHLAGCLGKPVLNLLCFTPYWIWGTRGDATPWYPSMRLLRQRLPGDWSAVFDEVHALVRGWARVRQREVKRSAKQTATEDIGKWFR